MIYEELCWSRRVLSAEVEGPASIILRDQHNSSYHLKAESSTVLCVKFPSSKHLSVP